MLKALCKRLKKNDEFLQRDSSSRIPSKKKKSNGILLVLFLGCKQNIIEVERRESVLRNGKRLCRNFHERKGMCNSGRDTVYGADSRMSRLFRVAYSGSDIVCIGKYSKMILDSFAGPNHKEFLYLLGSLKDHNRLKQGQMHTLNSF